MRSIQISSFDGLDFLTLQEIHTPAVGPEGVKIEVYAAGVNFPDLLMSEGKYQHKPKLPFTPGLEAAGRVLEIGEKVSRFKLGDRVMGVFDFGAFSEEAVVNEKFLMHIHGYQNK